MAVTPGDPRCQFRYVGAAPNDAAKIVSLATHVGGAVRVAANHCIMTAVGHLMPPAQRAANIVTMHLIEFLILTPMIFDEDLDVASPSWHAKMTRLSKLFADLLTAGLNIVGQCTFEELRGMVQDAIKELPDAERTLNFNDVLYDNTATNTWWDTITPRRLRAGDTSNAVFSQLRTMVTGHWSAADYNTPPFQVALDLLVPPLAATRSSHVQAAAVVAHVRKTQLRPDLDFYFEPDQADDEMGRRIADSEEDAFTPLFQKAWKHAYPELKLMLPACEDSMEVAITVKGLLQRLKLPSTFTDTSVTAFCKMIKPHLPNIQHGMTTAAEQDARVDMLMASVLTVAHAKGGTTDVSKDKDSEQWTKVYKQAEFQDLMKVLEGLQTLPLDSRRIVAEMMKSPSAAGWAQMAGKPVPQQVFKAVWGLSAHKGIAAILECVNVALARTMDGNKIPNAGTLISEKVVRNTISGHLANGATKSDIDYWADLVQPIVAKRDGLDALRGITTSSADEFFLDVRKLELSVEVLSNWFAMYGYTDQGVGSVYAIIKNIVREAKTLENMRDSEPRKVGLRSNFGAAANGIFKDFASAIRAMLAGPVSAAARPAKVLVSGSSAAEAYKAATEDIRKVVDEHKLDDTGVGRAQKYQRIGTEQDDGSTTITAPLGSSLGRSVGGRGGSSYVSSVHPDDSASHVGTPHKATDAVTRGWGDMAAKYGVHETAETLAFGCFVCDYKVEITLPTDGSCLAPYCHEPSVWRRNGWCTTPSVCKSNGDHARADGLKQSDITATKTDDGKADPSWTLIYGQKPKQNAKGSKGSKGKGKGRGKGKGGRGTGFRRQQ